MDLNICQSCKEVFDQSYSLPKLLSCGCIQCAKCVQIILNVTDTFKCRIHNQQVSIKENNVKDFKIQDYFIQEMNKFEQQPNLKQVTQELSSQAKLQKSKVLGISKSCKDVQKFFNQIVRQVTQILYQKEISGCQQVVSQIEQVLKKIRVIEIKYKQIKSLKMVTGQQCNNNIIELNKLVKYYGEMQTEVQRIRALEYQGSSQNYKIIQEVSFQVFQELMGMSVEQRVLVQDYSVMINKYTDHQNIQIQLQRSPIIQQPPYDFQIESVQHIQNILDQFKNQQLDMSSILNNPLNIISVCKNAVILYDLIKIKSEKNQQSLLQIVNIAKNQPKMQVAAANSLTILNFMNFDFTNQDFSDLDLSNSELSDTTFTSCNFSNSNLTQANLRNTKFINCNLSNSNLTSIITEHPHIFTGHTYSVLSVAISSDSEFIVSGSYDNTVRLWDVKTGTSKKFKGPTGPVWSVAISRDSEFIVSGSDVGTIILWYVKTGTCKTMSDHTDRVTSISISRSSEFIVSGS